MANIDLDKVGAALLHVRDDVGGTSALSQLRASLDAFGAGLPQGLNHAEQVFLLRTLMADLSIDHPQGVPNLGVLAGGNAPAVQVVGSPVVKTVHGFAVMSTK